MRFTILILTLLGVFQSCNSQIEKAQKQEKNYSSSSKEIIVGNGELIKKIQKVDNYTEISSRSSIDIVLTDGNVGDITVEAESNLIDFIEIESKSGTLYVRFKKNTNISSKKRMVVYIPVDKIESITSAGSGDIYVKKDLDISEFSLLNLGSGDIIFKNVKASHFTIKTLGSGDILIKNLIADNTNLQLSGSSDVKMEVNSTITKVSVSGSSDLLLTGKTQDFNIQISGSSDIKVDEFRAENVNVSVSGSGTIALFAEKTISASISGSGDIYYKGNANLIRTKTSGSGTIKKL